MSDVVGVEDEENPFSAPEELSLIRTQMGKSPTQWNMSFKRILYMVLEKDTGRISQICLEESEMASQCRLSKRG